MTNLTKVPPGLTYEDMLAATWGYLRAWGCCRQMDGDRTRLMWWHPENIFPVRTDFIGTVRCAFPRRRAPKQIIAAVRRLEACTLPWAPTLDAITAADDAMFDEGDRFNVGMPTSRELLIEVLHSVPADITPAQVRAVMHERFKRAACVPPPPVLRMTTKAGGFTHAQFLAAGWTDGQLIEHGYATKVE